MGVLVHQRASLEKQVVVTAHLASVLRTMAMDGRGIAWLPLTVIEDDLAAGRLVKASTGRNFSDRALPSEEVAEPSGKSLWQLAPSSCTRMCACAFGASSSKK